MDHEATLADLQRDNARLANTKLALEIGRLQSVPGWLAILLQVLPGLSVAVALAGFAFGVIQYTTEQKKDRELRDQQVRNEAALAERETMKPWIENQRAIYLEALAAAEGVANATTPPDRATFAEQFWRLYHGRMVLVETKTVSGSMKSFGSCLDGTETCDATALRERCLSLASAMKASMAATARMKYSDFAAAQFSYGGAETD